jgi:subtilisin family serine protease
LGLKNRQVVDVEQIATPTGVRPVVDTVLVKFRSDYPVRVRASARSAAFDKAGADPKGARRLVGLPGVWQVPVDEGVRPAAVARRLDARADVQWAARAVPGTFDTPPDDPLFPNLWGLRNTAQQVQAPTPFTGLAGVDLGATGAWATTQGSADVSVAIVDSGAVMDHPDLVANLRATGARNFMPAADGTVDPDAVGDTVDHGTHVAGTIGAVGNNGLGVTGVAWTVGMTPVRVGDHRDTPPGPFLEGLAYAGKKARVVNISMGFPADIMEAATDVIAANPNTLFVAAAGNDASDNDETPQVPCNVPRPNVLCVAAINADGAPAWFTNFGARSVDVAAPGVDIQSAVPDFREVFAPDVTPDGQTPPEPVGWVQTPAAQWTVDTSLGIPKLVDLDTQAGAGTGIERWLIKAPGTFSAVGRACRMSAGIRINLDQGDNQVLALVYRSTGDTDWEVASGSGISGNSRGELIPWQVDLPEVDGRTGVELAFLVQSAEGATNRVRAAVMPVEVKCIVAQPAGGTYGFMSGTSMAAPQVAGAAALLLAKNPTLSAVQLKNALTSTVVRMPSLEGKVVTGGRIDVNAALASVPAAPAAPATSAVSPGVMTALALRTERTIAVRRGSRSVPVPVTCERPSAGTCAVTVALRMRRAAPAASRARWIALGTRQVSLPGTWRGRVAVPLTRQARNLLDRHPRVRATVIAGSQAGTEPRASVRQVTTLVRR